MIVGGDRGLWRGADTTKGCGSKYVETVSDWIRTEVRHANVPRPKAAYRRGVNGQPTVSEWTADVRIAGKTWIKDVELMSRLHDDGPIRPRDYRFGIIAGWLYDTSFN